MWNGARTCPETNNIKGLGGVPSQGASQKSGLPCRNLSKPVVAAGFPMCGHVNFVALGISICRNSRRLNLTLYFFNLRRKVSGNISRFAPPSDSSSQSLCLPDVGLNENSIAVLVSTLALAAMSGSLTTKERCLSRNARFAKYNRLLAG